MALNATAGDLTVRLIVDLNRFTTGLRQATREIKGYAGKVSAFSKKHQADFKKAGLAAAAFAGTLGIAFKKGVGVAMEYEDQLAKVRTMLRDDVTTSADEVAEGMKRVDEAVRKAAITFGESTQELTDGLYATLSAGNSLEEGIAKMNDAAMIAVGQFSETGSVVKVLLTALESYGDETINSAKASDMLSNTVFLARTEMKELAPQIGRVIPVGKQLGVAAGDLLGLFAQLTLSLGGTEQATTSLSAILNAFLKPSEDAKKAFGDMTEKVSGYRAELNLNTIQNLGFQKVMTLISQSGSEQAKRIFENQRALKGLDVVVRGSTKVMEKSKFITEESGTAQKLWADRSKDTSVELNKLKRHIQFALIDAFNTSLPIIKDVADYLKDLTQKFADLDPATKGSIGKILLWGTILSGAGAILFGVTALLPSFVVGLKLVSEAVLLFKAKMFLLSGSIKHMMSLKLIGKLGAIVVAFKAGYEAGEWLRSKFEWIDKWVQKAIKSLDKFLGINFAKPVSQAEGLNKRLAEINKKYGIQAKTLHEALTLIKEKNKLADETIEKEKKAVESSAKSTDAMADLIKKIRSLKREEASVEKEAAQLEAMTQLRRQTFIDTLDLMGKEKEARLAELDDEYANRQKTLGKTLELEKWFNLSKAEIEKEYADQLNEKREEELEKIKATSEQRKNIEKNLIESVGFEWSGYLEWKKKQFAEELKIKQESVDDKEAAERAYYKNLEGLEKKHQGFKKNEKEKELKILQESLGKMTEANEEFYAKIKEISERSGESQGDIITKYGMGAAQGLDSIWEGMKAGAQETATTQANLFQQSQDLIQNGYNNMINGMSTVMSDFVIDSIQGNANLADSFRNFAEGMAKSFIRAVSQMIVKALVLKAVKLAAGIGAEGGGFIPEFAGGGLIPCYADGGRVSGNAGPGDNVRANLKGGEFVVKNSSVTSDTAKQLASINATGKPVEQPQPVVKNNIVNFTDPNLFQNYITKNPDTIINVVSADAGSGGKTRSGLRRTL
jgi:TP901 family phage tail tape measure protein